MIIDNDNFYNDRLRELWYTVSLRGTGYVTEQNFHFLIVLYTQKYGPTEKSTGLVFGHPEYVWSLPQNRLGFIKIL